MKARNALGFAALVVAATIVTGFALNALAGPNASATGSERDDTHDGYDHEFKKSRGGGYKSDDDKTVTKDSYNSDDDKKIVKTDDDQKCVDRSCNDEKKKVVDDSYNKEIDKDSHDQDNDKVVVKDVANTDTDDDQTATATQKSEDDRSLTNNCTDKSVTKQPESADSDGGDGGEGGDILKPIFSEIGDAGDGGSGGDGGDPSFGSDDTGDMKCTIDVDHTGSSSCSAYGAIVVQQCPGQVEGDNQASTNIRDDGSEPSSYPRQTAGSEATSSGGWLGGLFGIV